MCHDSNPLLGGRIGMMAPCVQISKKPSIWAPWEHDVCALQLWDTLNSDWLPPGKFQEQKLASYKHTAKERRLCWVVCSHRICQCRRCRMLSRSLLLKGCLERGTDSNRDKPEIMLNAWKQKRSMRWAGEECVACVSVLQGRRRSPVRSMWNKTKQKPTRYRWEQESAFNTAQTQRQQHWAHNSTS